ncbi:hypothetical protein [Campylobacter sp. RM9328]|uniref:hypothetical protein n=1 Tax=Campylobacter sp. RM9328 TaxID=1705720 RepID=UPI001474B3C1|nr:hypothetical protein [Campylobacter sp. RM9328]
MVNEYKDFILLVLVGFTAFILTYRPSPCKGHLCKIVGFLSGALGSIFLSWVGYEVLFFFTSNFRLSLAISGYSTWRGADWLNRNVDEFISNKIKKDTDI